LVVIALFIRKYIRNFEYAKVSAALAKTLWYDVVVFML
jgi:hypothetical protein